MAGTNTSAMNTLVNGHTVQLFTPDDADCPKTAADTDWLLVKLDQFVTHPLKEALRRDNHLEIHERLNDDNVYLCKYTPSDLSSVMNNDRATHVTLFPNNAVPSPGLVMDPTSQSSGGSDDINYSISQTTGGSVQGVEQSAVMKTATGSGSDRLSLIIALQPNPSQAPQQVLHHIETRFGAEHLDDEIEPAVNLLRVKMDRSQIPAVAAIDSVRSIEEVRPIAALSIATDSILGINPLTTSFAWNGLGETVYVADSGFDKGSSTDVHPAFTGRVIAATTAKYATHASDQDGHGTHVAGSVLGDLVQSPDTDLTSIRGTAPSAKLISLALDFDSLPPLLSLFAQVSTLPNPTIHTNSWGIPILDTQTQLPYGLADAGLVDKAMFADPELCILFAAGNDGEVLTQGGLQRQVGSYSSAKNSIVVGASKNTRPVDSNGRYDPSGKSPLCWEMTTSSSRGPTMEGRLGVDVVAPGEVVLSARSGAILPANLAEYLKDYGEPKMDNLLFSSGTSMSTPAVAGCVACLRQAYKRIYNTNPTGAMLKALIIHGAEDLQGNQFTNKTSAGSTTVTMSAAPNTFQGYGMVNMQASVVPLVSPITGTKGTKDGAASAGTTVVQVLTVSSGMKKLVVTLVYTDPPGKALQNVISLQLQVGVSPPILPLRPTDPLNQSPPITFAQNNVAKIVVANVASGTYQIVLDIQTTNLSAPYAVVWSAT